MTSTSKSKISSGGDQGDISLDSLSCELVIRNYASSASSVLIRFIYHFSADLLV